MRSLIYIIIAFAATACSCQSSRVRSFEEAEMLLSENPAKAYEQLNAIDLAGIEDSASMARWALLYSEALAANRLYAPTDTIVNVAIDYYSRHPEGEMLARAMRSKVAIEEATAATDIDALSRALYMQKEKEYYLFKARSEREQLIYSGIVAVAVALAVISWQGRRISLKERRNAMLMAEACGLREAVTLRDADCTRLENRLGTLLDTRFALIDSLCETYYETQGTRAERNSLVTRVKAEIESVKSDEAIFREMEKAVNDCRGNILETLKESWPEIKAADYRLAVYLSCRLSPRSISLLLGETVDVVYKRKSRLKSRLNERGSALAEGIIG